MDWHGPVRLVGRTERDQFPHCLNDLPVLLPTGHSALRQTLDHWFEAQGLRPHIVGEFEDSALLAVIAARGLGVLPASRLGADAIGLVRGLRLLGSSDGSSSFPMELDFISPSPVSESVRSLALHVEQMR